MAHFKVYSKDNCPFCEKAKKLITVNGDTFQEIKVRSPEDIWAVAPGARTVPQIILDGKLIGGHDALVNHYSITVDTRRVNTIVKKRTVFNANNKGHETGDYPLFFGDQLGFTDTVTTPYPILELLYQAQLGQIWNEFEIDLTQDRQDMLNADPNTVALMVKTIMWQSLADSVASRSIANILSPYISNTDLEGWYNIVQFFETIHSRTYQHIIKQTFTDPVQALSDGYKDLDVIKRSDNLVKAFDRVINLDNNASEIEKKEAVYLAVAALYMLEQMNFMASFAITFGIAETGIFQGISQDVALICRDEMLHAKGGEVILGIALETERKNHPDLAARLKPKMQELFDAILQDEMVWTDHLFSEGRQCPGINANIIKQYCLWHAQSVGKTLGLRYEKVEKDPLPYMANYIDTSKIQIANQEMQSGAYLVNSILAPTNMKETLLKLREKYGI